MNKRIVDADDGLFQLVRVCCLGRKTASSFSFSFSAIRNGFLGGEFDTLCSDAVEARESGR